MLVFFDSIGAVLLLTFGAGVLAPLLSRRLSHSAHFVLALVPFGAFLRFWAKAPELSQGQIVSQSISWLQSLNVMLSFQLDSLSLVFALLISGVGFWIVIYSGSYLKGHQHLGRFYFLLFFFMSAMLGLVLAADVITLFVFWELTTVSSYLLIGFEHRKSEARRAALQALLITGSGGLALLVALILMSSIAGGFTFGAIAQASEELRAHGLYAPIALLFFAGTLTKSAQFPFHFWLPGAMQAPTPVSAYLHSATMVKAGIYLLTRFTPVLGGTALWSSTLVFAGAATLLTGSILAFRRTDLKLILAYMTVAALGLLTLLLGIGTPVAVQAMLLYLLAHSLYKGSLFLITGIIDHETGTRDLTKLRGLRRYLPLTCVAALLSGLSMAGIAPLLGFIGKEMIYQSALEASMRSVALLVLLVLCFGAVVAAAGTIAIRPFFGRSSDTVARGQEAPSALWIGPLVLGAGSLALGVFPGVLDVFWISAPAKIALGRSVEETHLALWHGWNVALALSIGSLALGVGGYAFWFKLQRLVGALDAISAKAGPSAAYEHLMRALLWLANMQTRIIQNGSLRNYIACVLIFAIGLTWLAAGAGIKIESGNWSEVRYYEWMLSSLIVLGALAALVATSRLMAVIALGVVGYGVALVYVLYGAPDLAMTQFLVETLTVILFALVLVHVPKVEKARAEKFGRLRETLNLATAACFGFTMTSVLWSTLKATPDTSLIEYYSRTSVPLAHGRNIVNVILVDFRALDTLGEATVIALSGLGVVALVRARSRERRGQA